MAIPIIVKGDTSAAIPLTLSAGWDYADSALLVEFNGVLREFTGLAAGDVKELNFTADETSSMPIGTSRVYLALRNSLGHVRTMPWCKIKVTDSPDEAYGGEGITIDPALLNVTSAKPGDSLADVKAKLNAIISFLKGGAE